MFPQREFSLKKSVAEIYFTLAWGKSKHPYWSCGNYPKAYTFLLFREFKRTPVGKLIHLEGVAWIALIDAPV